MIDIKGFISYSHQDKKFFQMIEKGLKSHSANSNFFKWNLWDDREICIGTDWHKSIQEQINECDFAILLISSDFLSSEYVKTHEIENFIAKQQKMEFLFFPILVRDCDFNSFEKLSKIQFFVAHGDDYGIRKKEGQLITFSELVKFDSDGIIIPNSHIDTYFKNLVNTIEKSLLIKKKR
jgi:hypothetical protein